MTDLSRATIHEAYHPDKGWDFMHNPPLTESFLLSLMKLGVTQLNLTQHDGTPLGDYGINEAFNKLHAILYERGESFARLGDITD